MARIINGVKRYPFKYLKHDYKIGTYQTECYNAEHEAREAGNKDLAWEWALKRQRVEELDCECHLYMDGGGTSWLKGESIALAKDIVGGYDMRSDMMGHWNVY